MILLLPCLTIERIHLCFYLARTIFHLEISAGASVSPCPAACASSLCPITVRTRYQRFTRTRVASSLCLIIAHLHPHAISFACACADPPSVLAHPPCLVRSFCHATFFSSRGTSNHRGIQALKRNLRSLSAAVERAIVIASCDIKARLIRSTTTVAVEV